MLVLVTDATYLVTIYSPLHNPSKPCMMVKLGADSVNITLHHYGISAVIQFKERAVKYTFVEQMKCFSHTEILAKYDHVYNSDFLLELRMI